MASLVFPVVKAAVQLGVAGVGLSYAFENKNYLIQQAQNPENLVLAQNILKDMAIGSVKMSVKMVLGSYIIGALSKLNLFAPDLELPTINFSFKTNYQEVGLPEFTNMDNFAEGLQNIGSAIGNAGGKSVAIVGSIMLSLYAVYGVQQIAIEYFKKYFAWLVGQPTLTRKFKFDDFYARMHRVISKPLNMVTNLIYEPEPKIEKPKAIYDPEVAEQVKEIAQAIRSVKQNDGIYTNLLLWGPPGTGKTMTAEALAEESGVNYLEISGGDLAKYIGSNKSPVALLDEVFARIENSSEPVVIFIDEIDAVGLMRSKLDPPRVEILNALLNKIGTPSKKFLVIGATNLPSQLDSALLNRFDDKLHMGPPKGPQRREMIEMYIEYFFKDPEDQEVFTPELVEQLVQRLEGQTGRSIYKILNKCKIRKNMRPENRITKAIVERVVNQYFENQNNIDEEINKVRGAAA